MHMSEMFWQPLKASRLREAQAKKRCSSEAEPARYARLSEAEPR